MEKTVRLLRVTAVAARLSVTTRHVYNLIADGRLPAIRVSSRATRVSEEDLEQYMEANRLEVGA
ncbi:MAG: helix-turn-helix domain-containing protein [Pseudomonadota bacterium]